jgi:hypothetical protein
MLRIMNLCSYRVHETVGTYLWIFSAQSLRCPSSSNEELVRVRGQSSHKLIGCCPNILDHFTKL